MSEEKRRESWLMQPVNRKFFLRVTALIVIIVSIMVIAIVFFPQPSATELLAVFEEQSLAGMTYVEVASIKSGDVAIRLSMPDFVESCVNKTVYRLYNTHSLQDSVRYVFFVQGSDGELVEYFFSIRYVPVFPNGYQWREMT